MIGDQAELPLEGIQFNVRVDGFRARVLMDMYFYNDRDRQYEGTFKLRLPNGASPYYLAFGQSVLERSPGFDDARRARQKGWTPDRIMDDRKDAWTNVKEARMVTREKAAFAYKGDRA